MKILLFALVFCIVMIIPSVFAEEKVPLWIKNNAGWWAGGQIDDSSYLEHVDCLDNEVKFEKVANGIMLNCIPEDFLTSSPSLFKIIKEF